MPDIPRLSGVILAGGSSRRMGGSPKALLAYQNEKLINRQIRYMKTICSEIVLVTNEPMNFHPIIDADVRIIRDIYTGTGPLGGIHAAFSQVSNSDVWLVGCDMPFISPGAAQLMADLKRELNSDAVIPFIDDRHHPLHGIYDRTSVGWIPALINKGDYRVGGFLDRLSYEKVMKSTFLDKGIDPRFVYNVNTPEEYERALLMDEQAGKEKSYGDEQE